MRIVFIPVFLFCFGIPLHAQLKFVIEDFEGFALGSADLKANGIFTYGNERAEVALNTSDQIYSGEKFLRISKEENLAYGGWGKGIGLNVNIDPVTDHLNFYVYLSVSEGTGSLADKCNFKIDLQEDDNDNNVFDKDDSWNYSLAIAAKNEWQLISIPIRDFNDSNPEGDGVFNVNYKEGKLLTFLASYINCGDPGKQNWAVDFICLSKGKLPTGAGLFDAPAALSTDHCSLGAWSKEGNTSDFLNIAKIFEGYFNSSSEKKLGVVHFFQPFAYDGGKKQNAYPSVERINEVITKGYVPMITLEDHFVNLSGTENATVKQPDLKSIVDGDFDRFFKIWAKEIRQVKGIVLLRILHEFNGDWYPWCIANNHQDPQLFIDAYRHIHDLFKKEGLNNVKFVWCPNSMSIPQEKWNFIMDAYPGNDYVDFVGLDIYNGAGKAELWRSFRKEGIENYFILTQNLPDKPLLVCEAASRERKESEPDSAQNKAEWIKDMSKALGSDMSKVRLLTWFNEKSSFKVNSSAEAENAYSIFIWKNAYFKSGTGDLLPLLNRPANSKQ